MFDAQEEEAVWQQNLGLHNINKEILKAQIK